MCGRGQFIAAVSRADPFGRVPGVLPLDTELLDLAWQLLKWSPGERISAKEALRHPALKAAGRPRWDPAEWAAGASSLGLALRDNLRQLLAPGPADEAASSSRSSAEPPPAEQQQAAPSCDE